MTTSAPAQQEMSDEKHRLMRAPDSPDRVIISPQGKYVINGTEVVMMGGNYPTAPPYLPPLSVVQEDAKLMADGAKSMKYKPSAAADGSARRVVPCVRLAAMWESTMPDMPTTMPGTIDGTFAKSLDDTIAAFKAEGVYVFLDTHEDAMCTTNGGEGTPWWIASLMQNNRNRGCCGYRCSCCCSKASYITSPEHPLGFCCPVPNCVLKCSNADYRTFSGDSDPWKAYSVGAGDGDAARMNIGNASMRLNNFDIEWGKLGNTKQANNIWNRFIESPFDPDDKSLLFDPYMVHVKHLCSVWQKHWNVVGVGLWNEPACSGYSPFEFPKIPCTIKRTYRFYEAVLVELDAAGIQTPVTLEELPTGGLKNMTCFTKMVGCCPMHSSTSSLLKQWAQKGQLILQFHYYPGQCMVSGVSAAVAKAKERAAELGDGVPVMLGEFWPGTGTEAEAQGGAEVLAEFASAGCDASMYWLYTNTTYTDGNPGWYKYTAAVQAAGGPVSSTSRDINLDVWPEYEKTVRDGTSWGAHITGEGTGVMGVLELVPAAA
ncbi:unnamed protein product [Prorocentrum cordatum]|uniref:Glycoside hydrolase family 5 domain-containing protein n=1 Tax=Prorocentrum cordatum TaxID=2364126 RepID=A0ABN9W2H8_9DINO|nr:unnamed protein product [Polarella glacialis]